MVLDMDLVSVNLLAVCLYGANNMSNTSSLILKNASLWLKILRTGETVHILRQEIDEISQYHPLRFAVKLKLL